MGTAPTMIAKTTAPLAPATPSAPAEPSAQAPPFAHSTPAVHAMPSAPTLPISPAVPSSTTSPLHPTAASPLLPFCEYLRLRLKSDNVELLTRIATEFLAQPPRFTTVKSMLQLAFPLVVLLPVDNDDPAQRAKADTMLEEMKQRRDPQRRVFDDLRSALSTEIVLKNWDWLAQIYQEFCVGEEHCLEEFVRLQCQAISIIPTVPVISWVGGPIASGYEAKESKPVTHKRIKMSSRPKLPASAAPPPRTMADNQVASELRDRLYQECQAVEMSKPWGTIFDVSKIEYPFDAEKYPILAEKLESFWQNHAHAVWERARWCRLSSSPEHDRMERKWCQERASRIFESWVIEPLFKTFGAQFFVDFDKRQERHHWWFYREPVVDLLDIGLTLGEEATVQYLRSTCLERFPEPPPGCILLRPNPEQHGWSMFSTKPKFDHIRAAIKKAKQADTL